MKNNKNNREGFTLIELLVVVLIIGILAAIALPQYEKSVEKSRVSEALIVLNAIKKNRELCRLEFGNNSDKCEDPAELWERLTIELPGEKDESDADVDHLYMRTKDWEYDFVGGAGITAYRKPNPSYWLALESDDRISCGASNSYKKFCKMLCGAESCYLQ